MDTASLFKGLPTPTVTALAENAVLYRVPDGGKTAFDTLYGRLLASGASLYTGNTVDGNVFVTLSAAGEKYTLYHTFCDGAVRFVTEPLRALPPRACDNTYQAVTSPLLTQLKLAYIKADCGMSYLLRLCDGRFVVIDGGYTDYEETERLLDHLREQNVLAGKPVVAAWFFTHPHDDHIGTFVDFCEKYPEEVIVERAVYNFAEPALNPTCPVPSLEAFRKVQAAKTDTAFLIARAGEVFHLADAVFTVLATCDDYAPGTVRNCNDTSLIMRNDFHGRTVLWLGDGMKAEADIVTARYTEKTLRCEFLQVGHHGYDGGSPTLYVEADPRVLLWPCPDFWYPSIRLWASNDFIRTSPHVRHIFLSGHGDSVTDMTKDAAETVYLPDYGLPYALDLAGTRRVVDLDFESATGGSTGFVPTRFAFGEDENGRYVSMTADGKSVPGLLRGIRLAKAQTVAVTLTMACEGAVGVMANNLTATVEKPETVFAALADKVVHTYTLVIDRANASVSLAVDGGKPETKTFDRIEDAGLFLVLENAAVRLYALSAEAGK